MGTPACAKPSAADLEAGGEERPLEVAVDPPARWEVSVVATIAELAFLTSVLGFLVGSQPLEPASQCWATLPFTFVQLALTGAIWSRLSRLRSRVLGVMGCLGLGFLWIELTELLPAALGW